MKGMSPSGHECFEWQGSEVLGRHCAVRKDFRELVVWRVTGFGIVHVSGYPDPGVRLAMGRIHQYSMNRVT